MTKGDRGVLLTATKEPKVQGYLIIGGKQYWIVGHRVSDIRTNLTIKEVAEFEADRQTDLFDDRSSESGARKCDLA